MIFNFKRIYCPVDVNSLCAEKLLFPFHLAADFQAKLAFSIYSAKPIAESVKLKWIRLLNKINKGFDSRIEYEQKVDFNANTAEKIVSRAAQIGADLIVINSFGGDASKSLAETVCRVAPCSVLIVRTQKKTDFKNNFRRILLAHDFSDYSEIALQNAAGLSEKYCSELHLLHILSEIFASENSNYWSDNKIQNLYHETINRLRTSNASEKKEFGKIVLAVRWGKTYREILKYAEENEIELIVIGARGADFGSKTLFGSNTDRVWRQANCSVLIAFPLKPTLSKRLREISRNSA